MSTTVISLISMGLLGALFAAGLLVASRVFAVETDPRADQVEEVLPGANCGACGYAGCRAFAEAAAGGQAPPDGCPVGGAKVASLVAKILGVEVAEGAVRKVAQVLCAGGNAEAKIVAEYDGPRDCRVAQNTQNGSFKACSYGCLGLGTCVAACPFDAMYMDDNGLPVVIEEKCTGCGMCVRACPRNIIVLAEEPQGVHIRCRSLALGKDVRGVCSVGCIACRRCEKECPVDAITVENNLAEINYDLCINCRKCVAVCPMNTIQYQEGKPVLKKKRAS